MKIMKNIYIVAILIIMLVGVGLQVRAQTFECRLAVNDMGYLVYQMRETSGVNTPNTTTTLIADITFVIRWPEGMGADNSLLCATNDYQIDDALGSKRNFDGYDYRYWYSNQGVPIYPPHDWIVNEWEDIAVLVAVGGSGVTDFEIAPNFWNGTSLNWTQGPPIMDYTPTIVGGANNYTYPTVVYDYVWVGGTDTPPFYNGSSWGNPANWITSCGNPVSASPTAGNNCFIPSGLTNYPENMYSGGFAGIGLSNNVRIAAGANINWGSALDEELLHISGKLMVDGTLNIQPNAYVTVDGDTYLDAAESIVIQSTTDGTGSFINYGTIDYGAAGSAKVQTFITNGSTAPAFYAHFVTPTVQNMDVIDFMLAPGVTYAYEYNQATDDWDNIYTPHPLAPTKGIYLSTTDGQDHTLEAVGHLNTGDQPADVSYGGASDLNLIGNPYPSSVDFYALSFNNPDIWGQYYLWDPSAGAYISWSAGTPGDGRYIQVGQSFFVTTTTANPTVTFTDDVRSHSTTPFRDVIPNVLKLTAEGGVNGYLDRTYIRFQEGTTSGYDQGWDADHWNSWYTDATQLNTVAEDGSKLSINMLPPLDLTSGEMRSVPMQFSCGYAGEYTITASQLETFDNGTEIWLEDKQNDDIWFPISTNPVYSFQATPDDLADRFVVHFFGPTGIDETYDPGINIFSYEHNAYVTTNGTEMIKDITVYDLSGRIAAKAEISVGQQQYKLYVNDRKNYYVVRVTTDKSVFTEKVFIY